MKKISIILLTIISLLIGSNVYALPEGFSVDISENVEGYVGEDIDTTIFITIAGQDCEFNVSKDDVIKDWFTNIPEGLTATVLKVKDNDEGQNNLLYVNITGTTDTPIEENICVTISANSINNETGNPYESPYVVIPNDSSKYVIKQREFSLLYKKDYTVSGKVGVEIDPQDVVVIVNGDKMIDDIVGKTLTNDFGLVVTITAYNQELNEVTITYTGTPTRTSNELIDTTFPASFFKNHGEDAHVPNRDDVKFNITKDEVKPTPQSAIIPQVEEKPKPKYVYVAPSTGVE